MVTEEDYVKAKALRDSAQKVITAYNTQKTENARKEKWGVEDVEFDIELVSHITPRLHNSLREYFAINYSHQNVGKPISKEMLLNVNIDVFSTQPRVGKKSTKHLTEYVEKLTNDESHVS